MQSGQKLHIRLARVTISQLSVRSFSFSWRLKLCSDCIQRDFTAVGKFHRFSCVSECHCSCSVCISGKIIPNVSHYRLQLSLQLGSIMCLEVFIYGVVELYGLVSDGLFCRQHI